MTEALSGLPGFYVIHLFDKGFKKYFGNQPSFLDASTTLEAGLGGRVRHFTPADVGDVWYNRLGQAHPPPVTPLERGKLLWDLQANSTRAFTTAHRWVAEFNNGRDWGTCKMSGSRGEIPQQLLEPYGQQPTPQVPKIYVVNAVHHQLIADYGTPLSEVYELPPNVNHAGIGKQMLARLEVRNWLDHFVTGPSPFDQPNIFLRPIRAALRRGLLRQNFGVNMVNCLDPAQTLFPRVTTAELNKFCAGPYVADLAPSYVSSLRHKELERNQAYLNLANYHQAREQLSQHIEGWYFDQIQAPRNWNSQWAGSSAMCSPGNQSES